MTSNINMEDLKVIYIDTSGHRINPARGGQTRQQNIPYALPQRGYGPGALDNRPGLLGLAFHGPRG